MKKRLEIWDSWAVHPIHTSMDRPHRFSTFLLMIWEIWNFACVYNTGKENEVGDDKFSLWRIENDIIQRKWKIKGWLWWYTPPSHFHVDRRDSAYLKEKTVLYTQTEAYLRLKVWSWSNIWNIFFFFKVALFFALFQF